MMRTMTIKQFCLEEINRMLAEQGRDVQLVFEHPKPQLVADGGKVIEMIEQTQQRVREKARKLIERDYPEKGAG